MLKIRLSRVGRTNRPQYRVVVAEHSKPVKGKCVEQLGHYDLTTKQKDFKVKKERVEYWLSQGAQPTSSIAGLLKKHLALPNMEKFMKPRQKDLKSRKEAKAEAASGGGEAKPAATPAPAPAPKEAPKS